MTSGMTDQQRLDNLEALINSQGNKISQLECIKHYTRLSLPQFHRHDFLLVLLGIFNQIKSFETGIIRCKTKMQNGLMFAEEISKLTT